MPLHSEKFTRNYEKVKDAIARSTRRAAADRVAARTSIGLTGDDIAAVVADLLRDQRRDLVQHMERRLKLVEFQKSAEDRRDHNLHARITALESELRLLKKAKPR